MHTLKQLREIFSLSQQELATYLGITRTLYSMAETGRRSLPTAALIRLAALEKSLQNNIPGKTEHLQKQSGKDVAAMRRHIAACKRQAAVEKLKLEQLQKNYQQSLQALMAIDHLQANLPSQKNTRKDQLWLELLQRKTLKKLNRSSMAEQVKIKLTVQALELQAATAENMKF